MYKKTKSPLHFIGIGGIGMSGIAEVLFRQGFPVSGSDVQESDNVKKLRDLGVRIFIGHKAENLNEASVVVVSSAIAKDNPEYLEAQKKNIPIVPRAEMLAELMRLRFGIAVAGTHGKTTTTSMLASICTQSGIDPTVIVGGKVDALGGNAVLGKGQFLVAEADESDGSFLKLSPVVTIVTNIDNDHLDHYGQMERLRGAFLEFMNKVPYYGRSILCIDNEEVAKILPLVSKPYWTYGFSEQADFRIQNYQPQPEGSSFELFKNKQFLTKVKISVPGKHNALNATGALASALEIDLDLEKAVAALSHFKGVRRRFEWKNELNGICFIDDYAHHPTEISATLDAARQYATQNGFKKVVAAFQPHRFTRTQLCWEQFGPALKAADTVYLLDIYAAGESSIVGIDSEKLSALLTKQGVSCVHGGSIDSAAALLSKNLKPGDLLLTMGAGSVTQLSSKIASLVK